MIVAAQALYAAAILAIPIDVALRFRVLGFNLRAAHVLLGVLLIVVVLQAGRAATGRAVRGVWIGVPFLVAVLASAPASLYPDKTLGYAGWAFFDVAVFLVGIPLFVELARTLPGRAVALHLASAAVVCATAAVELVIFAGGGPRPPSAFIGDVAYPRLQALFYEPAYMAFFLVGLIAVALGWLLADERAPRRALLAVAVTAGTVVILSTARSGWISLAAAYAAPLALIGMRLRGRRLRALRTVVIAAAASVLVASAVFAAFVILKTDGPLATRAAALGPFTTQLAGFGMGQGTEVSIGARVTSTQLGLRAWREHPILGVGIGGFGAYVVDNGYVGPGQDPYTYIPSNMWVEQLAEMGVVGLAATAFLVAAVALRAVRSSSPLAAAYGAAAVAVGLVAFQFNQTFLRLDFWLLLGLGHALASARGAVAARLQ